MKISRLKNLFLQLILLGMFTGCAALHRVQVGNLDLTNNDEVLIPFEILLSEMGVSTEDLQDIARATRSKEAEDAAAILALFQFGPRTGNLVYNEKYAEKLIYEIHQKCPTGKVTGLISIRETRKYPVISGEIVKVTGYCRKPKTQESPS